MTTFYFIRHGQASFGSQNYDQLSENGQRQAEVLGQYLQKIGVKPTMLIAGSMQRHQQTAQGAFPDFPLHIQNCWNEFNHQQIFALYDEAFRDPIVLKQKIAQAENPRAYLATIFSEAIQRWTSGDFDHEYSETWPHFQQRIMQGFENLCEQFQQDHSEQSIVIMSSGGVISVLIGCLLQLDVEQSFNLNWSINNASISSIRLHNNKAQFINFNEHLFLKVEDPNLVTWL